MIASVPLLSVNDNPMNTIVTQVAPKRRNRGRSRRGKSKNQKNENNPKNEKKMSKAKKDFLKLQADMEAWVELKMRGHSNTVYIPKYSEACKNSILPVILHSFFKTVTCLDEYFGDMIWIMKFEHVKRHQLTVFDIVMLIDNNLMEEDYMLVFDYLYNKLCM